MNFIHFIPHVNRPDLTVLALNSVPALWKNTLLIDNSDNCSLAAYVAKHINFHFAIIRPPVPLTTAQIYNWMRLIAINKNTDFMTFMHNDCQLLTEGGDKLLLESATAAFSNKYKKSAGFIKTKITTMTCSAHIKQRCCRMLENGTGCASLSII